MRTIIAGSRSLKDYEQVCRAIEESGFTITEVVSGRALGADRLGERWANENGIPIQPFPVFPADWKRLGKAAGPIRNAEMAKYAEACIVIWDGRSDGSRNMINLARKNRLKLHVRVQQ